MANQDTRQIWATSVLNTNQVCKRKRGVHLPSPRDDRLTNLKAEAWQSLSALLAQAARVQPVLKLNTAYPNQNMGKHAKVDPASISSKAASYGQSALRVSRESNKAIIISPSRAPLVSVSTEMLVGASCPSPTWRPLQCSLEDRRCKIPAKPHTDPASGD